MELMNNKTIRRKLKLPLWATLPLGLLCSLNSCNSEKFIPERPNVIFIVLDDMNDFGITGVEHVKVPHIEKFRNSAVTFTSANCPSPLCIPSRASFFTGVYPHHSGVYANGGNPWNNVDLLKQAETLPELFRRNGYYSFGRGKIYHVKLEEGRLERNFDNRPIFEGGFGPFPDEDHQVFSEKDIFQQFWGVQSFPDSIFPDVINTDAVVDFLGKKHDKPFFVTLGLWRPHTPFTAPQRFFDLYDPEKIEIPKGYLAEDLDDVPEYGRNLLDAFGRFESTGASHEDRWKHFIHGYYACTSFADWNVGRLIDALDQSEYADNTIVVVFSDNGFHVGTKNHWEKNTLWDASAIVPLMVRQPGATANGSVVESPVGLIDLYPTLVDLCGLDLPKQQLDGKSLRPFLENDGYTWDRPVITSLGENLVSIRSHKYRYIQYPDGESELYDIERDPFEWTNLVDKEGMDAIVQEHQKYIPASFAKELPGVRRN